MQICRNPSDGQQFKSINGVGDDLKEGIVGRWGSAPIQPQVDEGGLGAFEVDPSFVGVLAVKAGPQGGARYEDLSPSSAYVG